MSGLDKIIDHITREAEDEADRIVADAQREAQKILDSGKEDVLNRVRAIEKQSEHDVSAALSRIRSASELQEKRIILQAKQDMIEAVFEKAVDRLNNLGDDEYFDILSKMVSRYASGEKGRILLSERDLARVSPEFKKACEKAEIPCLLIEVDRQMTNYEQARTMIEGLSDIVG